MEPQGYGEWRRRWEALKAHLTGRMSDPRVAEARRQQQAVTGDAHSRKVWIASTPDAMQRIKDSCYAEQLLAEAGMTREVDHG